MGEDENGRKRAKPMRITAKRRNLLRNSARYALRRMKKDRPKPNALEMFSCKKLQKGELQLT